MDMINLLTAADVDRSLYKKLRDYQTPDLLIIDEVGYLPLGVQGSNLFFQVISARHQKKSTMITSNLVFAEWGNLFDNTTVATAIADRLVHNSEVIPDFDSKCGFSQKNINNINESVREFSKV